MKLTQLFFFLNGNGGCADTFGHAGQGGNDSLSPPVTDAVPASGIKTFI